MPGQYWKPQKPGGPFLSIEEHTTRSPEMCLKDIIIDWDDRVTTPSKVFNDTGWDPRVNEQTTITRKPMASETRLPSSNRAKTSRHRLSVPNQCWVDGGARALPKSISSGVMASTYV